MDVVVQPSVPWMELNEQIKEHGLFFPVDPGPTVSLPLAAATDKAYKSQAQIGGMVGTGCSGTNAVRYGTMKDWVMNLTVVLADGTSIKTRRRPRKSSAGYNLNGLFVGSEGTLGLVTEITLKLAVIPQETSVAVVTFPSIRHAAAAASSIMRAGIPIAAMEIMDDVQMRVINQAGATSKQWQEVPTMFFKFAGTRAGVQDNIQLVRAISNRNQSQAFEFTLDGKEKEDLWQARKNSLWSMLAMRNEEGQQIWGTDVAVPFSRLPDLIETSKRDLDALGLFASALGHIGDGNFHTSICWQTKDPKDREKVEKFVHTMVNNAIDMEGTCTGEHGIGIGKKGALLDELGLETVDTMKTIKAALDPCLLLNPGKIFDFDHAYQEGRDLAFPKDRMKRL
ncbi:MAG: hypothetical protein Q9159_003910 [Coniocarpon cinnabarinum]